MLFFLSGVLKAAPAPNATIVIIRDAGNPGTGNPREILIDDLVAGAIFRSERLTLLVNAAEHIVGARPMGTFFDFNIKTATIVAQREKNATRFDVPPENLATRFAD